MTPLRSLLTLAVAALCGAASTPARAEISSDLARLLAATDPFVNAPDEVRLELVFTGATGARVPLEIWRRGEDRSLVRFLSEKDLGKFVLRRGAETWLLTPGARKPVRMSPVLAPAGGAALDQLFALRIDRDYRAESVREQAEVVTFDLEATAPGIDPPRLRWVVDRARRLPMRVEFRTAEDRVLRLVEFKSWSDEKKLVPDRIVAKDLLRGGTPLDVEILAVDPREVPELLFDLDDDTGRKALPPPPADPTP